MHFNYNLKFMVRIYKSNKICKEASNLYVCKKNEPTENFNILKKKN